MNFQVPTTEEYNSFRPCLIVREVIVCWQFVDDYTINCVDVFAMPQSGTSVSVEAVDPVFQTRMLDMLKQTGRSDK